MPQMKFTIRYIADLLLRFLPRNVMHNCGLCRRAVYVRPSSGCLSHSYILWKRVIIFNFFTVGYSHRSRFSVPRVMAIFQRGPLTCASNTWKDGDFRPIYRFVACCQRCDRQVLNTVPPDRGKSATLVGGVVYNTRVGARYRIAMR